MKQPILEKELKKMIEPLKLLIIPDKADIERDAVAEAWKASKGEVFASWKILDKAKGGKSSSRLVWF